MYFELCDLLFRELHDRFDTEVLKPVLLLENLILHAANEEIDERFKSYNMHCKNMGARWSLKVGGRGSYEYGKGMREEEQTILLAKVHSCNKLIQYYNRVLLYIMLY